MNKIHNQNQFYLLKIKLNFFNLKVYWNKKNKETQEKK